jgi:LPXTG-site transpeptidase (sortase) family protein
MRFDSWRVRLGGALVFGGAIALGYVATMRWHSLVSQSAAKARLEEPYAGIHNNVQTRPHPGELSVPRLHIAVMVLEGDNASILDVAAGHIPETALPNASGNIGIAAHRDTFFRPLRLIRPNDLITLTTPGGVMKFSVTNTEVVPPEDTAVLAPGRGRDLTLVTCYPFSYIGPAPKRFIVHARKIS